MAGPKKAVNTGAITEEKLNKARVEFEKYRQRMKESEQMPNAQHSAHPAPFVAVPGAAAIPQWPPSGPLPAQFMPPPFAFPQSGANLFAGGGPFFENVGKMLNLGVAFATSAFAGGMQVIQGFSGMPAAGYPGHCQPPAPQYHGGHDDCHHPHHDCCGTHHDQCCSPGVNNCDPCC